MSQYTQSPIRDFPSSAALSKNRLVKMSAGILAYAGSTDLALGALQQECFLTTLTINAPVRLMNSTGTIKMVANAAITAFNPVYAAANGKVAPSGTIVVGKALEAAGADGDVIEILPLPNTDVSAAITGTTGTSFTVAGGSGKPRTSIGYQSGGTGDFTATLLPPATLTGNRTYTFVGDANDTIVGATVVQTLTNKTIQAVGAVTSNSPSAGVGYATGAGAAVTQATDRTTGVTCTGMSGAITTQATSLAAGAEVSFTVTNTSVAIGDVVVACIRSGPTATTNTFVTVTAIAAGSFVLTLNNPHASTADIGAAIINFAVFKAVSA